MMIFWNAIAIDFRSLRSLENFLFSSVKLRPKRCFQDASCMQNTCISVYILWLKLDLQSVGIKEVPVVTKSLFWAVS